MYCLGCLVFSFGAKFFIDGRLGTDPLDVLVIGLNHHLHAGMGICSSLVAGIFLAWWTLWNRRIPPLTPFVTSAAVGFLIDLWTWLAITSGMTAALSPYLILFMGLFLCAYGSSLIIMSGIGIRIMDLVALTMIREWNWSFFRAKMSVEVCLFITGWLLGGPLGFATLMFLVCVGPSIQPCMTLNQYWLHLPNCGLDGVDADSAAHGSVAPTSP
ncbi:MAG: hypothetical protein PCALPYG88_6910 [uncultured Paraburkholderia sp.]|nr:MAG: hypothetical protein PCALPYG08_7103 [uncultured Paraburkholderia sp.]CAH2941166.1 MAG: hypothetical protein PCALPYG88_6910 [uncultured Paraburkholderia sp.]